MTTTNNATDVNQFETDEEIIAAVKNWEVEEGDTITVDYVDTQGREQTDEGQIEEIDLREAGKIDAWGDERQSDSLTITYNAQGAKHNHSINFDSDSSVAPRVQTINPRPDDAEGFPTTQTIGSCFGIEIEKTETTWAAACDSCGETSEEFENQSSARSWRSDHSCTDPDTYHGHADAVIADHDCDDADAQQVDAGEAVTDGGVSAVEDGEDVHDDSDVSDEGANLIDLEIPDGAEYDIDDLGDGTIVVQWWIDDVDEDENQDRTDDDRDDHQDDRDHELADDDLDTLRPMDVVPRLQTGDRVRVEYESIHGENGNHQEITLTIGETASSLVYGSTQDGDTYHLEIEGNVAKANSHGNLRTIGWMHVGAIELLDGDPPAHPPMDFQAELEQLIETARESDVPAHEIQDALFDKANEVALSRWPTTEE